MDSAWVIGVNLTSNPVTECCLTIKSRSPLLTGVGFLRRGSIKSIKPGDNKGDEHETRG